MTCPLRRDIPSGVANLHHQANPAQLAKQFTLSGLSFTGIDFETANRRRPSDCALGLTKVVDGQIVDRYSTLVNPPEGFRDFHKINVSIHGITREAAASAPEWEDIHDEVSAFIGNDFLVAHNAPYDRGLFQAVYDIYDIEHPTNPWACTLSLVRKALNLPSYGLAWVSESLNLPPFEHHDAGADAEAASLVLIELANRLGMTDLNAAEYVPKSSRPASTITPEELGITATPGHSGEGFSGEHICFTGALNLRRKDAEELAIEHGAITQAGVTKKTTIVVVGGFAPGTLRPGASMSSKLTRALQLREHGQQIEILTEQEFVERLAVHEDEIRSRVIAGANGGDGWKLPKWAQDQAFDPGCNRDWYQYLRHVVHPDGRAMGGESCIWCGSLLSSDAHWTYRNRHVCGFQCNTLFKQSARRFGKQKSLFDN